MLLMVLESLEYDDRVKAEKLVKKYQGLLYTIAYKIIQHEQSAEDIVCDAWIKILSHLDSIDENDESRTKGFLVTIVENTAFNEYKKNKRKYKNEINFSEDTLYYAVQEKTFENMELYDFIHKIEKKYGEVLILYYVHGYKLGEIGKLLDISEATASRRLNYGISLIKEQMLGGNADG